MEEGRKGGRKARSSSLVIKQYLILCIVIFSTVIAPFMLGYIRLGFPRFCLNSTLGKPCRVFQGKKNGLNIFSYIKKN